MQDSTVSGKNHVILHKFRCRCNEGNQQFNLHPLFHYPLIVQESRQSSIACFHQRNEMGLGFLIYSVTSLNQIVLTEQIAKKATECS